MEISTPRALSNSFYSGRGYFRNSLVSIGFLVALASVCCLLGCPVASQAGSGPVRPHSYGYFDFPTCVRYALVHSEDFLKTRLDIQFQSAELKDAHSELLPTIQVTTRYYLAKAVGSTKDVSGVFVDPVTGQPVPIQQVIDVSGNPVRLRERNEVNNDPFSVSVIANEWDPFLALVKIKSYGILVDIGKISHHEKIAENIAKMGKIFYRIHVLEKMIRARKQILALHQNKISYGKSRLDQGAYDSLTLRSLQNSARGEQMRIGGLERELKDRVSELKMLMGYHPDFELPLETRDAANQILNGFNGNLITFGHVQGQNLSLKILAKQEQLQSSKVTGAYVALVPKPFVYVEDVQNQVDRTSGFNFAVGLNYTLWDGFRRVREIKKQKVKAEQAQLDRNQLSQKLYNSFKNLRGELDASGEKEGFYREQAKLAELAEEKAFLSYKAGSLPYDEYIARRMERVEAEISSVGSVESRVDALIDLATIAGGLNKYNAAISF